MRWKLLACDYDGTLARDGGVAPETLAALERLRGAGFALVLLTGRRLDDLRAVFDREDLFERLVAENGAVLHRPGDGSATLLAPAPPRGFVRELARRDVEPLAVGRAIVATHEPHGAAVRALIREWELPLQVIGNKGAVMVLPEGVDKGFGLTAALAELGVPPNGAVGVGDAENDLAFLELCGLSAAVADAHPDLLGRVDRVLAGGAGTGVGELARTLLREGGEES